MLVWKGSTLQKTTQLGNAPRRVRVGQSASNSSGRRSIRIAFLSHGDPVENTRRDPPSDGVFRLSRLDRGEAQDGSAPRVAGDAPAVVIRTLGTE